MEGARSKSIENWFVEIDQGHLVLPRFQRHLAWRDSQIIGLFENILRKPALPIGVLLTLEVGDEQPFVFRTIEGAPNASKDPRMHLLDGQQRMTALWKALNDKYDDKRFFIDLNAEEEDENLEAGAHSVSLKKFKLSEKKGKTYPLWISDPKQTAEYGYIPLSILRPGNAGEVAYKEWLEIATEGKPEKIGELYEAVTSFRGRIANYPVPFLSLDKATSQNTALNVFINMNTSATPLKAYDIVVAQHEGATGESLHDKMSELRAENPLLKEFKNPEDMMLSVAALLMGKPPIKKSYLEADFGQKLEQVWQRTKHGFRRGMAFLEGERIFGEKFVPSDAAIYLAIALWAGVKDADADAEGNAREIITNAFWRGCLTDRYGKTSATRTFADYKPLKKSVAGKGDYKQADLFDADEYPLPERVDILKAGWPTRKDRLPRSILALSLRNGGRDFADDSKATKKNVKKREYHHIFPVQILGGDRQDANVARALNCSLITWKTNRKISANTPKEYLIKRTEASNLGEKKIKSRLKSHLIPYKPLMKNDYDLFLGKRAKKVEDEINRILTLEPLSGDEK